MKEYTLLAFISVAITVILDRACRTVLFRRREYYLFLACILFFMFLVNGFLTGKYLVIYNPDFFLGIRLSTIPLEDFLFGFSMVSMTIIFWEYFKHNSAGRGESPKP